MNMMDGIIDSFYKENPKLKEFGVKPSEVFDTFNQDGLSGLSKMFFEKKDKLLKDGNIIETLAGVFMNNPGVKSKRE